MKINKFNTLAKLFSLVVLTIIACKKDNPNEQPNPTNNKLTFGQVSSYLQNQNGWKEDKSILQNVILNTIDTTLTKTCDLDNIHTFKTNGIYFIDYKVKCNPTLPDSAVLTYYITANTDSIIAESNTGHFTRFKIEFISENNLVLTRNNGPAFRETRYFIKR